MNTLPISRNEGSIDRILRVVVGAVLLTLVVAGPQAWWGLVGVIPLTTGALGVCPLYSLLGVRTCKEEC